MLQELGLSPAAEAVYQAMLAEPQLGIAGLCERLALTEHEVRASLDDFARFLVPQIARPTGAAANSTPGNRPPDAPEAP